MLNKNDIWKVIDGFFRENGLVKHQLDSFNDFINIKIYKIIEDIEPIKLTYSSPTGEEITHTLTFKTPYVSKPQVIERNNDVNHLTPNEARLRSLTYESTLYVNVHYEQTNSSGENIYSKVETINFCNIPIMVGSNKCVTYGLNTKGKIELGECEYDQGGYFIINGNEKSLIAQERMASNNVYVFLNKLNNYMAEIRSIQEGDVKSANQVLLKYIKPVKKTSIVSGNVIRVGLPHLKKDIPIIVLLKVLGMDEGYETLVDNENLLYFESSIEEGQFISSQEQAIEYIGKRSKYNLETKEKRKEFVLKILKRDTLSHIYTEDVPENFTKKIEFLSYMINKLLYTVRGRRELDDRDHWGNKRIDLSSNLLGSLFRSSISKVMKTIKMISEKYVHIGKNINLNDIKKDIITKDIRYAMSTGNWSVNKQNITKTGVSQVLSRLSYLAALSHLRRIVAPIAKDGKSAKPRQLHVTSFGYCCPAETPEGHACGIVKNMSLSCHISTSFHSDILESMIKGINENTEGEYRLFFNGKLMGKTNIEMAYTLRDFKRTRKLNFDTGISIDNTLKEIKINTDAGRCSRPLLRVENGKLLLEKDDLEKEWKVLIDEGKIEYLDVYECENAYIAMDVEKITKKHTHAELHPSMMMSVCSGIIPYPDHNQAPRNCYQSSMCKQAMGIYSTNFDTRMDTISQVLFYPQKRLVEPKTSKYVSFTDIPAGMNAIVAIMCHTGMNQEDSLILNKASIERGLFRSVSYKTYKDEEKKKDDIVLEEICKPDPAIVMGVRSDRFSHIGEDGLPYVGTYLEGGDVMIGKTVKMDNVTGEKLLSKHTHKDISHTMKNSDSGIVDRVMMSTNLDGEKFVKIRTRSVRIPEMGDKLASTHGQKGTIGITYPHEDMPFTREGITPDIIINTHCIPSRMTVGQLIECVVGKAACFTGKFGDATPFDEINLEEQSEILHQCGFQKRGYEVMYNGKTGERIKSMIFIGPTYYQRLKHMVQDKQHAISRGSLQNLVRQPIEGRSKNGGLRFGEMERDAQISHGAANFLREKLFVDSDFYKMNVCGKCGLSCLKGGIECKTCKSSQSVKEISIPYASKLLFQELMAMNITPRIVLDDIAEK